MANKKIKIFALENREGFWGRFHDARLPGESRAPIKLLTRDESLPNFVINQLWEKNMMMDEKDITDTPHLAYYKDNRAHEALHTEHENLA